MTNKEKYADLCKRELSISIYDQPWWMDAVCGADNWDVLLYENGNEILGTHVYYVKEKFGLKYITQPPLTQHNGVWIKYQNEMRPERKLALENKVMKNLIEQLEHLGIVFYRQSFAPEITNWLPFYWNNYVQTTHYTFRFSKNSCEKYETLFANINKSERKSIENVRNDVIVEETDDVCLFRKMQSKTFERQGLKQPYTLSLLNKLYAAIKLNKSGKILIAKDIEGNVHSASCFVYDHNWVYQLMSGTDPKYKKYEYKNVLVDEAIRFACISGRGFDFEGSMLEGVNEYMRKFNASMDQYFYISKNMAQNPVIKLLLWNKMK